MLVSDFRATTATIPTVIIIRTDITGRTTGITDIDIIVITIPIIIGVSSIGIANQAGSNSSQPGFVSGSSVKKLQGIVSLFP